MEREDVISAWFMRQVQDAPAQRAVFDERRSLTYAELSRLADAVAAELPAGAAFVGIVMDHGVELIASILAVLKTGAAYVPAEPDFPIERVGRMMRECGVAVILTQEKYAARLQGFPLCFVEAGREIPAEPRPYKPAPGTPDSLAYVLYTSGSTGAPKGVAVENRNVCHYIRAFQREFRPTGRDIMLQQSVCSFDIFVEEVFGALLSGATLAVPSKAVRHDFQALMRFIEANGVTMLSAFPYLLQDMNQLPQIPARLRLLISGGDVLRESYVSRLLGGKAEIYNTYGPSETTVCATYFKCTAGSALEDGTFPIGKPVQGVSIRLLDEALTPVPPGATGEICISGGGVSRGYIGGRGDEAFIALEDGGRLYRSGDLGRFLPDGNLAFLRRKDAQVMILGKRVEPEEVESVLCKCSDVKEGLVRANTDEHGLSYLTAYIVPRHKHFSLSAVQAQMAEELPPYMIPEYFVRLDHIPMTPNGKPDRAALPAVLKTGRG